MQTGSGQEEQFSETARLRVSRVVTVIDAGRILNPLAGRSQIEGAVVMGIGMALLEHRTYDVSLPGMERQAAQALVDAAHQVCPYSNATRGNIDVAITVV